MVGFVRSSNQIKCPVAETIVRKRPNTPSRKPSSRNHGPDAKRPRTETPTAPSLHRFLAEKHDASQTCSQRDSSMSRTPSPHRIRSEHALVPQTGGNIGLETRTKPHINCTALPISQPRPAAYITWMARSYTNAQRPEERPRRLSAPPGEEASVLRR